MQKFRKISQVHIRKKISSSFVNKIPKTKTMIVSLLGYHHRNLIFPFPFTILSSSLHLHHLGGLYKHLKVCKTFSLDEVHALNNIHLSFNLYIYMHMIQYSLGRPDKNIGLVFICWSQQLARVMSFNWSCTLHYPVIHIYGLSWANSFHNILDVVGWHS